MPRAGASGGGGPLQALVSQKNGHLNAKYKALFPYDQ
jgi:hypothetical protein